MPYIPRDQRERFNEDIDDIIYEVRHRIPKDKLAGAANYLITRLVLGILKPTKGWNYSALADTIKTFECAKSEVYRRLVAPYEDKAAEKNGDLTEFTT